MASYRLLKFSLALALAPSIVGYAILFIQYMQGWNNETSSVVSDASMIWNMGPLETVEMVAENTGRYRLESSRGAAEWAALVQPANGTLHSEADGREFTLSMFHQLECLDIIRAAVLRRHRDQITPEGQALGDVDLQRHCLNYLRQMVLCRGDTRISNVRNERIHGIQPNGLATCQDWTKVYEQVKQTS